MPCCLSNRAKVTRANCLVSQNARRMEDVSLFRYADKMVVRAEKVLYSRYSVCINLSIGNPKDSPKAQSKKIVMEKCRKTHL